MAIMIHIYYTGKGDQARQFAQEMCDAGIVQAIRSETGNLQYDYFLPLHDPHTVLLIDHWKDQKALDLHHASPMMQKIISLREKYDLHMQVKRYQLDERELDEQERVFMRE